MLKEKGLTLGEVAKITGGELILGSSEKSINGFSIDSRTINKNELFIALKGQNFDGHSFISEVCKKKAAAVVVSREVDSGSVPLIMVEDTKDALISLARFKRQSSDSKVIAVTGSNGKTSVKDMLSKVLSSKYEVLFSKSSYNNIIGLSLTLLEVREDHEVLVLELGSNSPGEISALSALSRPEIAIITNIGRAHLEKFHDLNGVFLEKTSLLDDLPEGASVFLNGDDDFLKSISKSKLNLFFYGYNENSCFRIERMENTCFGIFFVMDGEAYEVPVVGRHNVYNCAASIAAAKTLGVEYDKIREALKHLKLQPMRLQRERVGSYLFLNDAYNANPESFHGAIDVLAKEKSLFKIVVSGDMLELGEESERLHYGLGREISQKDIDFLICRGKFARNVIEGAIEGGMDLSQVCEEQTHCGCAERLYEFEGEDAAVLLKGSRQSRMEEVIKCFMNFYTH